MSKKLISIILSCVLVVALALVGVIGASAAIDTDGRYVPSEGTETHRLYFAMPESWKSEKFSADTAGAYWWSGTDKCGSLDGGEGAAWPGYKIQVADADANLFYLDIPTDVPNVIFNNSLNGGERSVDDAGNVTYQYGEEQFKAAKQTVDILCQYYSEGDNEYYDSVLDGEFWAQAQEAFDGDDKTFFGDFADNFFEDPDWGISMNFNNMIYVTDPNKTDVAVSGKETYGGEFYFYYGLNEETGKYEYGALPNYDMAKEAGLVYEIDKDAQPTDPATPDEPTTEPTTKKPSDKGNTDNTNPTNSTVPTAGQNPTSSANAVSTSDTANNGSNNSAVQTGATTAAAVLAVLLVAGGAVLYTRKRFE